MNEIQQARSILDSSYGDRIFPYPQVQDSVDQILALALEYGELPLGSGSRFIEKAGRLARSIIRTDGDML